TPIMKTAAWVSCPMSLAKNWPRPMNSRSGFCRKSRKTTASTSHATTRPIASISHSARSAKRARRAAAVLTEAASAAVRLVLGVFLHDEPHDDQDGDERPDARLDLDERVQGPEVEPELSEAEQHADHEEGGPRRERGFHRAGSTTTAVP